jgi:voltage-gated potassium channel
MRVKDKLRLLYEGDSLEAHRFRYGLLIFDISTIIFIVASSFLPQSSLVQGVDVIIGLPVLADFSARLAISSTPWRDLLHPTTLRLLHTYQLLARLRSDSVFFRRNEELIIASVNLGVFIFIMTGFIYETQHRANDKINNYVDALYFTMAALTTTGFGDITLTGTLGHLISVVIMIFGVTLFLRLV